MARWGGFSRGIASEYSAPNIHSKEKARLDTGPSYFRMGALPSPLLHFLRLYVICIVGFFSPYVFTS